MPPIITDPDRAARLARTIASDIALYNKTQVVEGLRNDDLFERLAPQIKEGREHYASRVEPTLLESTNFLNRALVDMLVGNQGQVDTKIW